LQVIFKTTRRVDAMPLILNVKANGRELLDHNGKEEGQS
jgi:hypothetical protein